jgi:hypothetical protein
MITASPIIDSVIMTATSRGIIAVRCIDNRGRRSDRQPGGGLRSPDVTAVYATSRRLEPGGLSVQVRLCPLMPDGIDTVLNLARFESGRLEKEPQAAAIAGRSTVLPSCAALVPA